MRSALACAWCRKAKVKCKHEGYPPCRSCSQNPGRECILTYPTIPNRQRPDNARSRVRQPPRHRVTSGIAEESAPHSRLSRQRDISPAYSPAGWPKDQDGPRLDPALINVACQSFVQQFPEFGFIHQPTFLQSLQSGLVSPLKSSAIVLLSSRNKDLLLDAAIVQQCAVFTRQGIMARVLAEPDVDTVQILTMLSLYEWGNGRGFQSWMYLGMAIQMGETLISSPSLQSGEQNFLNQEILNRTLWACFVMNCILSGGKGRKDRFCSEIMPFPQPANDDDFTFQTRPEKETFLSRYAYRSTHMPICEADWGKFGSQHCLNLIIRGVDIWSAVTNWANKGGRRSEPDNELAFPWNESSNWNKALAALESWKREWAPNLVYTRSNYNMRAFVLRQHGPAFAMVNLLYHVSVVFLHREYTPFLPHRVDRPVGPIDPPLLPNTHPSGWWENSAESMFDSAISIVNIVQDLEDNGVQLRTPLVGFWMYTAALSLHYGHSWPHMTRKSDELHGKFEWAISWLREVSQLWDICKGWENTVDNLQILYETIKRDASRYLAVGRDNFVELEDNVQRVAEVDAASPFASREPAHILIALSQSNIGPRGRRTADSQRRQATRAVPDYLDDLDQRYRHTAAEDMDDIMRALLADQHSINTTIGQPMPDFAFGLPLDLP